MKLYTKRGDQGLTDLFGGQRVPKDHLRVEAYGTLDELNSFIGWAIAATPDPEMLAVLQRVQARLFDLGADLATPPKETTAPAPRRITAAHVQEAEHAIDAACADVPAMRAFILPGGTELAARLHVARAVCRRAERLCVALDRLEPLGQDTLILLNRLSDLLFALARRANWRAGQEDLPWRGA